MKFLPFVFKHLRATWVRTGSTVVAMGLCVFLFCMLRTVLPISTSSSRAAARGG